MAKQEKPKIGAGAGMAFIRAGAHELTAALQALPDSNIKPQEEPGALGNPTPQQVFAEQQSDPAAEYDRQLAAEAAAAPTQRQRDRGMEI